MTTSAEPRVPAYIEGWPPLPTGEFPPGPRLPSVVQTLAFMRFRSAFVPRLHRRYGDVFTIRLLPDGRPLVVYSKPDQIKDIFAGDPENFHAGKGNAILGPVMGEHSVLLLDASQHKRARKLLMPAFSARALKGYEELIAQIAKDQVDQWPVGTTFASLERMNALTLAVIIRVVFGVTDEHRVVELQPLIDNVVNVNPLVLVGASYPQLGKIGMWKAFHQNQRELNRVLYAEIAERRQAADLATRTDVLSQLLHVGDHEGEDPLTDAELRDQLVTLLLAGHETTATALAWSLYELGRSPQLLGKAQGAADSGDDAYLEAVLKESMRLHPVIPIVTRLLMKPAVVGGVSLPAGAAVAASIELSHSENFADPQVFRPERFIEGKVEANTWIPFGGGVRRCIGAGFSLMEGVTVLREVLTRYDLSAQGDDVAKVRNITSVPKRGARLVVTRRTP
ncbi:MULTISPECIES: cytochrome P450 [unclassified Nocardioides]|uniref:cytochrome P450 n=1 Tax=unclassified Nocardioides TaxID=2615069 RepID=UPI0009E8A92E|nr:MULTISPECIES: cytochrome P450 [unclassified Nocardioides]